ncbi:MAG: hypothetical protein C5B51_10105 [Terriglobia bacterium]|nr:MAG: hypothetical protein C5B51_10105 [Terriglobia bacterium]
MTNDDHPDISSKGLKEVVAFGKKCSKNAFPNPSRAGCPDHARLRAMAQRDPSLNLNDLPIAHVVRCSPCFQEYMRFRHMLLLMRGLRVTGASLALALVFVTVWVFVKHQIGGVTEPSRSQQKQPQLLSGADHAHSSAPLEPLAMKIDLASFSPRRGDEESIEKRIHLPRRYLRLTLQMPLGMEPGEYLIEMRGPSDTVYSGARAPGHIEAGTTSVDVDLDLARATLGKSTLMIRPPGLSWQRYPALIE